MCSHINYSFGKININLIKQYDSNFKRKKKLVNSDEPKFNVHYKRKS